MNLKEFKTHIELNYSNLTYYNLVNQFLKTNNLSQESLNSFVLKKRETFSIETLNGYLKAIKVYCKFINKDLKLPKLSQPIKKIPDYIPLDYLQNNIVPIVDKIFNKPLKIKALLYFMFFTGVRRGELYNLKRKNINISEREVIIYAKKTRTEYYRFFPEFVASILDEYFKSEPEKNNAFNLKKWTIKDIFLKLKPYFKDIDLRPNLFRHSYATYLFEKGANSFELQNFMGHKNINSTLIYINRNKNIMKEKYDSLTKKD